MSRRLRRVRLFFVRRRALLDALEEAYQDCTRYRRERDALANELHNTRHELHVARFRSAAPRSVP